MNTDRYCSHATQQEVKLRIEGSEGTMVEVRLDQLPLIAKYAGAEDGTFFTYAYEQGGDDDDWEIRLAVLKVEDRGPISLGALMRLGLA